jgi:hypothetical protein
MAGRPAGSSAGIAVGDTGGENYGNEAKRAASQITAPAITGDTTGEDYGNEARRAANDAAAGASDQLGKSLAITSSQSDAMAAAISTAQTAALGLARSSGVAGSALQLLPLIIRSVQASSTVSSAGGSSGGGLFSWLFGGSGGGGGTVTTGTGLEGMSSESLAAFYGHTGGLADSLSTKGMVNPGVFAGAPRLHDGGMVQGKQMPELKTNEVAAILMGGPKGTREEVLHANDPRHRDNLSPEVLRLIQVVARGGRSSSVPIGMLANMRRYHTGGVVGLDADLERPVAMRPRTPATVEPVGAASRESAGWGGGAPLHVYVTPPPGMNRDTATQTGVRIGSGIQQALRRRGGR